MICMRCLVRNQIPFWYALYSGYSAVYDTGNYETGEQKITYHKPVKSAANISPARGESSTRQFGEDERYDRVLVTDDMTIPVDEQSVLWIDTVPELDANGALKVNNSGDIVTPWDYEVRKVAKSLNHVSIAITKVKVS